MTVAPFVVIRGAPGVGKSTVASALRQHYPEGMCIEVDSLRLMQHSNSWDNVQQHLTAIRAAAGLARHYEAAGYWPIILVDTFSFGTLGLLRAELPLRGVALFSLLACDSVLTRRITQRLDHGFKDWKRSLEINRNIAADNSVADHQIDTTALDVPGVVRNIIASLTR